MRGQDRLDSTLLCLSKGSVKVGEDGRRVLGEEKPNLQDETP